MILVEKNLSDLDMDLDPNPRSPRIVIGRHDIIINRNIDLELENIKVCTKFES